MTPAHTPVSSDRCNDRHRWLKWSIGIVFTALGLLFIAVGWTLTASYAATTRAEAAAIEAQAVAAENRVQDVKMQDNWEAGQRQMNAMKEAVNELKTSLKESNHEIIAELKANRDLVQKIYEDRSAKH